MPIDQKTFDALKGLWQAAGGAHGAADLATSIAFAESGGCQYALAGPRDIRPLKQCTWNRTSGENSCGYWQINLYAHPTYSAPAIFDAYTNARAAIAISHDGTDFGAWSTYSNGAYKQYLAKYAGQPAGPPPPPGSQPPPASSPDVLTQSWASGWRHASRALGRDLPAALHEAERYRRATLRHLQRARKVR